MKSYVKKYVLCIEDDRWRLAFHYSFTHKVGETRITLYAPAISPSFKLKFPCSSNDIETKL